MFRYNELKKINLVDFYFIYFNKFMITSAIMNRKLRFLFKQNKNKKLNLYEKRKMIIDIAIKGKQIAELIYIPLV